MVTAQSYKSESRPVTQGLFSHLSLSRRDNKCLSTSSNGFLRGKALYRLSRAMQVSVSMAFCCFPF